MSKQQQDLPRGKLPLPQPRSPRELDEKILAYARERAPQTKNSWIPRWNNGWATGLATASIVVIAVFITQTQQPAPILTESIQAEFEQRGSDDSVLPSTITPPAPTPEASRAYYSEAPMRKAMKKEEALADQLAPQSAGSAVQEEFADSEIATDTIALSKSVAPKVAVSAATPDIKERASMDARQLDVLREHLSALLQQGHEVEAREAYQTLRALECPDCDLPETLAQWLADQREDTTP